MLQGTGSSVGKSVLTAGLARALTLRGLRVRPFKPQNMSNNAAVTPDGGEIGRAQALQARACRVPPSVHMNPVLLKPQSEIGSQIVVQGRVRGSARAREYQAMKPDLMPFVLDSFARLGREAEIVLVEGAGSASEVNLRRGDIANMGFAAATETPVILVGDIDRGGVIASLVGTHTVLPEADRALIRGFIVNRMRGDPGLFADGMRAVAGHTGWVPVGLVPFLPDVSALPAEDAADLLRTARGRAAAGRVRVAVLLLPMIANFDDLDPLLAEPDLDCVLLRPGEPIPGDCAVVLLPGSKATIADLAALRAAGWDIDLVAHRRRGGRILGLCGGYQMLGRSVSDPDGTEGPPGTVPGLGLLAVDTVLAGDKHLSPVTARLRDGGAPCIGYEMHIGRSTGPDRAAPFLLRDDSSEEGAVSADGRVAGTYLHGLFAGDAARAALLQRWGAVPVGRDHEAGIETALDALAAHLERHLDIDRMLRIARGG
ncbi:cobyric acid synthase [Acetobacteraceae bacterium KSS8]|uniref:Cobyric acid synthase n=1 Tax=Endosaccharibacter trunci TaxID=2812733 RepID=A0ABT1W2K9_9PROT|nr:cobyric acid synthase [Acetobacteraceae bacterium KSS8]